MRIKSRLLLILLTTLSAPSFSADNEAGVCPECGPTVSAGTPDLPLHIGQLAHAAQPDQDTYCAALKKCNTTCPNEFPASRCGLSGMEYHAIQFYTGNGYRCLNKQLREKPGGGEVAPVAQVLNAALKKLPSYEGFVSRGANLPKELIQQHQVGAIIEYKSFTSTSTGSGFGGNIHYTIVSKTGKPIMAFSTIPGENEVLFQAPTRFKVIYHGKVGFDTHRVVLKEVPPDGIDQPKEDAKILKTLRKLKSITTEEKWSCLDEDPSLNKNKPIHQRKEGLTRKKLFERSTLKRGN